MKVLFKEIYEAEAFITALESRLHKFFYEYIQSFLELKEERTEYGEIR